ncbi:MAG TPA: RIP metalloprotease RseP [Pyrinomonadaceae bacterium]|nr:RIP metalloprotease RseP [Pyrinomonadaceae bacterium]
MPDIVIAILGVLFVFGIAINIHEFGHFIVGKMLGMRIDAYSFFGIGKMIWKFRRGNTDYGIAMFPIGAYVKFYGDEGTSALEGGSSTSENVPREEMFEFRPRWQKFLVMLGGPLMNIILALAIPFTVAWMYGVPANLAPIVGYVKPAGAAEKAGLKVGDRIVNFEGVENPAWERIQDDALLIPEKEVPIIVERDGQRISLKITPTKVTEKGQSAGMLDLAPDMGSEPVVVGSLESGMPAAESGLQRGDWITSVNGKVIRNSQEMKTIVGETKDQPITLSITRNNERKEITTRAVQKGEDWRIGIAFDTSAITTREPVGIVGAFSEAVSQNVRILRLTAKALGQVGTGERSARDSVQGPIGIVQTISSMALTVGFSGLLFLLGLISLNLGVMNLLPIPMLDGGQIVLLGVEKILSWFGKPLSMALKEKINLTGFAILILLMIFTTFNDISRFFR